MKASLLSTFALGGLGARYSRVLYQYQRGSELSSVKVKEKKNQSIPHAPALFRSKSA